jgi:signal transduction histidine kinase
MVEIIYERLEAFKVNEQAEQLKKNTEMNSMFNLINTFIVIINKYRQIIYANKAFSKRFNGSNNEIIGKRLGEVFGCEYSNKAKYGCGTAKECLNCGVLNSVLKAIDTDLEASDEAMILQGGEDGGGTINILTSIVPTKINEEAFFIVSITDITDSIHRRLLEKVFFHDILNTASALKGLLGLIKNDVPSGVSGEVEFIENSFQGLVEEILCQRQLIEAENNELILNNTDINTMELLEAVKKLYERHDISKDKNIILDNSISEQHIKSDFMLLKRIIGNMLKNALEASEEGQTVLLGCDFDKQKGEIELWVHNEKYMTREIQNQVFKRAFSTKGRGRGIGTYSIKLLGEKYLKGLVGFYTEEKYGTKFYLKFKK